MAMIEMTGLHHSYGKNEVLKGISLRIEKGTVIGLLGPSGAGKTTLVNLLTGQITPTSGSIRCNPDTLTSGIMMDSFGLYSRLSVWDNLAIFADIYGVSRDRIPALLKRAGLAQAGKATVSNLSKGMRSRVNLCRALLKDTDILYLDEPTSGLDPATTEQIHRLIEEEKARGTTIFLTTHNMHEAEKLCDHIFLLDNGRIIEEGSPEEICQKHNTEQTITLTLQDGESRTLRNTQEDAEAIYRMLLSGEVVRIHSSEPDLETVFLSLTGRRLNE